MLDADPYKDWNGVILRIRRKDGNARSAEVPETATTEGGEEDA